MWGLLIKGLWLAAGFWASKLVVKILLSLGITYVAFEGAEFLVAEAQDAIYSKLGGVSADVLDIMNLAGFDTALTVMFAGWSMSISGMIAMGAFVRWRKSAG